MSVDNNPTQDQQVISAANQESPVNPTTPAVPAKGAQPTPQNGQPSQGVSNPPQNGAQPVQGNQPATATPAQPPVNPTVKKASWIHEVAQTLAGGPQFSYSVDPKTGATVKTEVPVSTAHLGMAIALHALEGGISGGGAKGPNAVGEAGVRGLQQGEKIQQQKQQQDQEAHSRAQQDYATQAMVINNNLKSRQLAVTLADHDYDTNQKVIDQSKPLFDLLQNAGAIVPGTEQGLSEDELTKRMQSDGQSFARENGIPVGSPEYVRDAKGKVIKDADGVPKVQMKYALFDPTKKVTVPDEMKPRLVYWNMPGYVNSATGDVHSSLADTPIRAGAILQALNTVTHLDLAQKELTEYGQENGVKVSPNVLRDAINAGSVSKNDILALEQVEGGHPVDVELNLLAKSNPAAAGRVAALYNGIFPTSKYGEDRAARVEEDKKTTQLVKDPIANADQAQAVLSSKNPAITKDRRQEAKDFLAGKAATAGAEAAAKSKAEANTGDIQQAAQNVVSGDLTNLKDITSMRGGQRTAMFNAIHDEAVRQGKNPNDWSPAALKTKSDMYEDYRQGKTSNNIAAFDAFLGHANDAMDANDAWRRAGSPLINRPLSWLAQNAENDTNYTAFTTALEPVRKEFMSFLNANRAEHEADLKVMQTVLNDSNSPAQIETALKQLGKSADIRLAAIGKKYANTMGAPFPNLVSDDGKQTLQRMGITSKTEPAKAGPVVPVGATPGRDASGKIIGYKTADGKVVTF